MYGFFLRFLFVYLFVYLFVFIFSLVFLSSSGFAYIDEYNSYNNNSNGVNPNGPSSGNSGQSNDPSANAKALSVFQDVDCQHMGCQNQKEDFFNQNSTDNPGDEQKTFQILPESSKSDVNSTNTGI